MIRLKAKPWELAEKLSRELEIKVISANDGMRVDLD
jgi:hypothetical protein